jgi:hypothetical protein
VHFSREYVKHFMACIPAKKYVYWHNLSSKLLRDIPDLEFGNLKNMPVSNPRLTCKTVDEIRDNYRKYKNILREFVRDRGKPFEIFKNNLFINTWVLAGHWIKNYRKERNMCPLDTQYWIDNNYRKYTELVNILNEQGIKCRQLNLDKLTYIPSINYKVYDINGVDEFVKNTPERKILICNGQVNSGQIFNFTLDNLINKIVSFKNIKVITTVRTNIPGVLYTGDIIQAEGGDLNEISYLSKFCDIIIGRGSGPFCFCETKDNYFDDKKRFIAITNSKTWGFWWYNHRNMVWTNNPHAVNLSSIVIKCMEDLGINP